MPRTLNIPARFAAAVSTVVLLTVDLRTAAAQESFAQTDQVARLNELLGDGSAAPARLVEVSRLLADPKDQLTWLTARAETLDGGETATTAKELANLTDQRADGWTKLGIGGLDPLRERLKKVGKAQPAARLVDITDPQALAIRVANANDADFAGLSPADRAILCARGVPEARLKSKANVPDWDIRSLVFDLGVGRAPLSFAQLIARLDRIRTARTTQGAPPFAEPSCAAIGELYSLALGLGSTAAAGRAAAALEAQHAWAWAALARIAEAAAPGGNRDAALGKAHAHLASLQLVRNARPDAAAHVASLIEKWIERLERGAAAGGGDAIATFDTSALESRRAEKRALASKCQQEREDDAKLRLMQQAKAAEVGFPQAPTTVSMADLKLLLFNENAPQKPGVHLFLEMLEVGDDSCIGLVIGSKTGGLDDTDAFVVEWLGPASSADLVNQATRLVGFRDEAKIIIAPDGRARTAGWAGESTLKSLLKSDNAWVIYVPTASALKKASGWKPIDSLRYFFYAGDNADSLDFKLSGASPQSYSSPFRFGSMKLFVVGLGADVREHAANPTDFCKRLMIAKRGGGALGVVVVGFWE